MFFLIVIKTISKKEILNYEKEINNFLFKLYKITPQEKKFDKLY